MLIADVGHLVRTFNTNQSTSKSRASAPPSVTRRLRPHRYNTQLLPVQRRRHLDLLSGYHWEVDYKKNLRLSFSSIFLERAGKMIICVVLRVTYLFGEVQGYGGPTPLQTDIWRPAVHLKGKGLLLLHR